MSILETSKTIIPTLNREKYVNTYSPFTCHGNHNTKATSECHESTGHDNCFESYKKDMML